jgi:hypothetical protein
MRISRAVVVVIAALTTAAPAIASTTQESMFETGGEISADPAGEFQQLRELGVDQLRLPMVWNAVAPAPYSRHAPAGFHGASPAAYPAANWARYDALIEAANAAGISVNLDLAGRAPLWAMPPGTKKYMQGSVYPSPAAYEAFVEAAGKRYTGSYRPPGQSAPLPRVTFWSVWNEPDYISSLQPQSAGPHLQTPIVGETYRNLVDAAWKGLHATGHGSDKFIWGELAPRYTGPVDGLLPLVTLRAMYCVDSSYHVLRGTAATALGCPTTAAGSRRFRSQHPALFQAAGVSDHPYSRWYPPNEELFPDCGQCTSMGDISHLTTALDRLVRVYGSNKRFPIYSTEYGYQTSPPKRSPDPKSHDIFVSQTTAAAYINWAEYISYKNPRILSYDQYLLYDPAKPTVANDYGSYASGLETWNHKAKASYAAFRLPLYLPTTTAASGQDLEVWGDARAASYAAQDTDLTQTVYIQFEPKGSGSWADVQPVTIANPEGYFDVRVPFTVSGNVRLAYVYPMNDPMLPDLPGTAVVSRSVAITVN